MIRPALIGVLCLIPLLAISQSKKGFSTDQFWIGFKGGANLSQPVLLQSYSVWGSPAGETGLKTYNSFRDYGGQLGVYMSYELGIGLAIAVNPGWLNTSFSYNSTYSWSDPESSERLTLNYLHRQSFHSFQLPIFLRYNLDFAGGGRSPGYQPGRGGKFTPYVQACFVWTRVLSAKRHLEISENTGIEVPLQQVEVANLTNYVPYQLYAGGGIGVGYNLGNAQVNIEINYVRGLANITAASSRFLHNELSTGYWDVPDDLNLNSLNLQIGIVMPLKFIVSPDYIPN